ncbi:hypothetical protein BH23ACT8_BH23ACT8_23550 [soil metagenome]
MNDSDLAAVGHSGPRRPSVLDGEVLGVRELLHDHAGEQPFTRSLGDLVIPSSVPSGGVSGSGRCHPMVSPTCHHAVRR